jgi:hypothetical protein
MFLVDEWLIENAGIGLVCVLHCNDSFSPETGSNFPGGCRLILQLGGGRMDDTTLDMQREP